MLNPILEPVIEPQFYLEPDVFVAFGKDAAALFKIGTDKYEGLDTSQTTALSHVVHGWPAYPDMHEISKTEAEAFAEFLVGARLLTRDSAKGKVASQIAMAHPENALVNRHDQEVPAIRLHHVLRFVSSLFTGYFWWKCHMDRTIRHVQRPKPPLEAASDQVDIDELRELVRAFYWIRPWFYEKRVSNPKKQAGLCFFDSLVMLEFLAKYHFYPTLVFGVAHRPFAAHSWVQEGSWILNGSMEYVSSYDCIMATTRREA